MKKLLSWALLAALASGCATRNPKNARASTPVIGMNLEDFKLSYPRANLVYLANDTTTYEIDIDRGMNDLKAMSDFFHFKKDKLYKFEHKTHYFNQSKVQINTSKDQKN
ncbi:hypothetical protein EV200_101289 [Pedobacter psychrotolerans]|uniref:Uncharacterized protein n=1 Tax=Pedobacter psychrotolerans TaxID=1843235 RepID=A0A4R2HLA6_9SPHI|nr:hypothetical protein [Pedobacter psychrotolerans]TCO30850.1 hypothetical protein EV200_101289 [Pedobacter psychrotolerans]GGE44004.1 hypothetical protein GCM10011413_07600 [Pedobacter psychrotolerans]